MKKKKGGGDGVKEKKYFFPVGWGTKLTRVFLVPSLKSDFEQASNHFEAQQLAPIASWCRRSHAFPYLVPT